ncbi:MAG: tetratricopeptide repeat protein [Lewinellaceae bacterium]|nr:tetratricopeptide repeat protein [Saprospiraceae bacterium]MCB9317530.1 tetratricopeptide repeat protein [Lewinellaceae bacterium]MCB9330735.1 tetratricopeptide repeat protein [Lewinellaceae bacterium]
MRLLLICTVSVLIALWACQTRKATSSLVQAPPPTPENVLGFCGSPSLALDAPPGTNGTLVPLFAGLDNIKYPVSTSSKMAQRYFNQGLMLAYGFNHAEAARSFQEAARQDPDCAMAYWGLAWVLGPNYNGGMEKDILPRALDALAQAKLHLHKVSQKEKDLILALEKRYPSNAETDPAPYYEAFATAIRQVMNKYPDDADIAAFTGEALMDLHPWDLWEKAGQPKPWTPEIVAIGEKVLALHPNHPQGLHLMMHIMEASPTPEKALPYANILRFLVPGSGHLTHMPSHLYINTGDFHEGALANERAVKIDSAYIESCHVAGVYPLAYYPHNWHFLAACAALEGRGDRALKASKYMADYTVDQEIMRDPSMTTLQHYYSIPWYIMVKFSRWNAILSEKEPDPALVYPRIIWHYARGMAYCGKNKVDTAQKELDAIRILESTPSLQTMTIWEINNAIDLVHIAQNVLEAEIAFKQGNTARAIELYTKAVAQEDLLNYNEPPDWFFSVRHPLGHVLLQAGKYAEAEMVYREDLKEWKNNGWALMGLYQSLVKQGKTTEAQSVKKRYDEAWKYADAPLNSSVI